ncbi:hypothetical protein Emin_0461 [Elusimicrobium minutum Pei191]|uniref:Uncharacterized protein n=1 Tax=Elusimicrobium minutum (strain Pei191) TaxID=445932 RepID=B2KBJ6_ELUMP|nr:hypothetical protein [Elusimicrobium minutum]ACC98018.1 hypothetical protein Emin_0461 [Elusimicrobium minutum Pei191]
MGKTGGALFVGGVGVVSSGYAAHDAADALGTWVGSENLSTEQKLVLGLRIGNGVLGAVTGPLSGVSLLRTGNRLISASSSNLKTGYLEFDSYSAFKRELGIAGTNRAWHHIVEQTPSNKLLFGERALQNTDNIVPINHGVGSIHQKISSYYSSKQEFTGNKTVRQWLSTQSYEQQYDFGLKILDKSNKGMLP